MNPISLLTYNKYSLDTHRYILNQCVAPFVIIVSPTQINNTCLWQSFNFSTKEFFLATFTFCHPCISCLKLCLRVSLSYLTLLSSSCSTYTYLVSPHISWSIIFLPWFSRFHFIGRRNILEPWILYRPFYHQTYYAVQSYFTLEFG